MGRLLIGLVALAVSGFAADITGTWTGPVAMVHGDNKRDDTAHFVLKQDGGKITGTVGPANQEGHTITKGTVEGNDVYIEAAVDGENKIVLRLKLEGDKLTGSLKAEGPSAPPVTGTMTLTKKQS